MGLLQNAENQENACIEALNWHFTALSFAFLRFRNTPII